MSHGFSSKTSKERRFAFLQVSHPKEYRDMSTTLDFIRSHSPHISALSERRFSIVLRSWKDSFLNAAGVNSLFFPLSSRILSRSPISGKRTLLKCPSGVHYTPLIISHWPAHKSPHSPPPRTHNPLIGVDLTIALPNPS
ncbi:hypothetical protein TNCV_5103721 [Trichonephila clavipes]|nr:hypothetical protein TNCV_5103721 [Trichonephila clavipes]